MGCKEYFVCVFFYLCIFLMGLLEMHACVHLERIIIINMRYALKKCYNDKTKQKETTKVNTLPTTSKLHFIFVDCDFLRFLFCLFPLQCAQTHRRPKRLFADLLHCKMDNNCVRLVDLNFCRNGR